MGNWKTSGKHASAMNVSGEMLPHFVDVIETDRPEFSPRQQGNPT